MSVDLNDYFTCTIANIIKPKQNALERGSVLRCNNRLLAVQMFHDSSYHNLYFRVYNETHHVIAFYTQNQEKNEAKIQSIGNIDTTFEAGGITKKSSFMLIVMAGFVVKNAPKIDFKGNLRPEEEDFYRKHPQMIAPKPIAHKKEWTMAQIATGVVVGSTVTIGLVYLVLKAKKSYNVQLPELPPAMQKKIDQVREWWKRTPKAV